MRLGVCRVPDLYLQEGNTVDMFVCRQDVCVCTHAMGLGKCDECCG